MFAFLPRPIVGVLTLFLLALNLVVAAILIFFVLLGKWLLPGKHCKKFIKYCFDVLPHFWIANNNNILKLTSKTQLDAKLPTDLRLDKFYLVISNHQSWADILILFNLFDQRIPMLKFFLKTQLAWVPLLGALCWVYGYPFMHRHTKAQLQKHPEWKGKDFIATRKACERFKTEPGSLMIFAEGTRFTQAKHDRQHSPYTYLLKPKAGGMAFALQCMDNIIDTLISVTIVYSDKNKSFWRFCCGKADKITVHIREIPITKNLHGDYENDPQYRARFQQFINGIWQENDRLIKQTYEKYQKNT